MADVGIHEADALVAVLEGDEDEASRLIGEMSENRRSDLAMYAERLATLARYHEGEPSDAE